MIAVDYIDMENKSDVSDGSVARSVGSSSSNHLDSASGTGEHSRVRSHSTQAILQLHLHLKHYFAICCQPCE